jgi:hypothetical protein
MSAPDVILNARAQAAVEAVEAIEAMVERRMDSVPTADTLRWRVEMAVTIYAALVGVADSAS